MSDEAKKLTADELKVWDQFAAIAMRSYLDGMHTNESMRRDLASAGRAGNMSATRAAIVIAAEAADYMLYERRERGQQ